MIVASSITVPNDNLSLSVDTSTQGGVEYFNALTKALQNFNAELDANRRVELDGIFDPANVTRQTGDTAYEFYLNLWKLTDEEKQQLERNESFKSKKTLPMKFFPLYPSLIPTQTKGPGELPKKAVIAVEERPAEEKEPIKKFAGRNR